jgi:hypothetical protein
MYKYVQSEPVYQTEFMVPAEIRPGDKMRLLKRQLLTGLLKGY